MCVHEDQLKAFSARHCVNVFKLEDGAGCYTFALYAISSCFFTYDFAAHDKIKAPDETS